MGPLRPLVGGASDNGTRKYKWPYQNSETNGGNGLKI